MSCDRLELLWLIWNYLME